MLCSQKLLQTPTAILPIGSALQRTSYVFRFFNLVLLPRVRDDIAEYRRLNYHLYMVSLFHLLDVQVRYFLGQHAVLWRSTENKDLTRIEHNQAKLRGLEPYLLHFHCSIYGNCSHCSTWSFYILWHDLLKEVTPLNLCQTAWRRRSKKHGQPCQILFILGWPSEDSVPTGSLYQVIFLFRCYVVQMLLEFLFRC